MATSIYRAAYTINAGHAASCPEHTALISGLCYDITSTEAPNLQAAVKGRAAKGGYLPSPMELFSVKGAINLGSGVGTPTNASPTTSTPKTLTVATTRSWSTVPARWNAI